MAAEKDGLEIVKYLVEQDADIKISNKYGEIPQYGRSDVVKYLEEQAVNI